MQHQAHAAGPGLLLGLAHGLLQDALLFVPALGVEAGKLGGQLGGPFARRGQHQFQGGGAGTQASGRVDARGQGKDHLPGPQGGRGRKIAGGFEGRDAHAPALGDLEQAVFDQDAVLAAEFHHVGQGTQGHEVEKIAQVHLGPAGGVQFVVHGRYQKKSHAHAGQGGTGAGTQAGIEQTVGPRHFLGRQVVVGDDDGQTQGFGDVHGLHVRDAAVHGQKHAHALGRQTADDLAAQAVALAQAVGNIVAGGKAVTGQKIQHQGRGSDAVHVIVAPDADLPAPEKFFGQRFGGGEQAGPGFEGSQAAQGRVEKNPHAVQIMQSALP